MKNLSIIIPHKNSFITLKKLIESIPKDKEIEIIIIDDHSNKETISVIKEEYAACNNIIVLQNESNVYSAGRARNIGLEVACGKWLLFADADDYFLEGFQEEFQKVKDSNFDIIYFRPDIDKGLNSTGYLPLIKVFDIYEESPTDQNMTLLKLHMDPPWSKLVKREFVKHNKIKFDEVKKHNDTLFSKKIAIKTDHIKIVNSSIYHYAVQKHGLTNQFDLDSYYSVLDVQSRAIKIQRNNYSKSLLMQTQPELFYLPFRLFVWGLKEYKSIPVLFNALKIFKKNGLFSIKYMSVIDPIRGYYKKRNLFKD